jgi:hypothetical protein
MTIRAPVRGRLGLFPDPGENSNACLEVTQRNILDQLSAQVMGGVENLVENGFGTALEMNRLATPIRRRPTTFHPPVVLQTIEQARKGRTLDPHPLGDLFLGKFVSALGKVHERSPFPLAQAEGPQTPVELRAPGTGGAEENQAELVDVRRRHAGND